MATINTGDDNFGVSKWIVDPTAGYGTHTTISAALLVAATNDTIYVRPGTYTENLNFDNAGFPGTNVTIVSLNNQNGPVIISGTSSLSSAKTISFFGVIIKSNGASFLSVTGSASSVVSYTNCDLTTAFDPGITFTSSNASATISINESQTDITASSTRLFNSSSAGSLSFINSILGNSIGSTTANTISAGLLGILYCSLGFPITTSGTSGCGLNYSIINTSSMNVIAYTCGGSASTNRAGKCIFISGTAAAISIGSTLLMDACEIVSSNATAVITGAGTLNYTPQSFTGVANSVGGIGQKINVTTRNPLNYGTWTPTITGGTTAGTTVYAIQQGLYTIVGNIVFIEAQIGVTSATGTGNATIGGLPFTIKSLTNYIPIGTCEISSTVWTLPALNTATFFLGTTGSTNALIGTSGSGVANALQMANGTATLIFSCWYQI